MLHPLTAQHQVWIENPSEILLMRGWLSGLFCEFNAWGPVKCTPSFQSSNIFGILNSEICCKWFLSHFEFELKHH
jgi:hypothetical protein